LYLLPAKRYKEFTVVSVAEKEGSMTIPREEVYEFSEKTSKYRPF
jgi:hypothetical protein